MSYFRCQVKDAKDMRPNLMQIQDIGIHHEILPCQSHLFRMIIINCNCKFHVRISGLMFQKWISCCCKEKMPTPKLPLMFGQLNRALGARQFRHHQPRLTAQSLLAKFDIFYPPGMNIFIEFGLLTSISLFCNNDIIRNLHSFKGCG